MERDGLDWYPIHWSALHNGRHHYAAWRRPGKRTSQPGLSTTMLAKQSDHQEAIPMPNCVACGVELEPPVRVSHTIYAKTLYRIAGQEYCRHHIIRAAVAAGVGPVVARP